jgi:hypothetical protein
MVRGLEMSGPASLEDSSHFLPVPESSSAFATSNIAPRYRFIHSGW